MGRSLRVLGIVTAWPRFAGDVITPWLQSMAAALGERDVTFEILAPSWRGEPGGVQAGTRVHRFRYAVPALETLSHERTAPTQLRSEPWRALLLPGYLAGATLELTRLVREAHVDVVHAFWPFPHAIPAWLSGLRTGVPFVSSFFSAELALAERLPGAGRVVRELVHRSAAVTVNSHFTGQRLRAIAPSTQPVVIPFGSTVEPADQRVSSPESTSLRAVFIGRLVERKGLAVLIRAVARTPNVELEVLGEGPLRTTLETQARGLGARVTFRGFVSDTEKRAALERSDVLVLPAIVDAHGDTEGQGVVILEAMALGRAVIASEVGGIPDLVERDRTGLLVAPGDEAALATALERVRDDRGLREALGVAGLQRVKERFAGATLSQQLVDVYRAVCTRGSR